MDDLVFAHTVADKVPAILGVRFTSLRRTAPVPYIPHVRYPAVASFKPRCKEKGGKVRYPLTYLSKAGSLPGFA